MPTAPKRDNEIYRKTEQQYDGRFLAPEARALAKRAAANSQLACVRPSAHVRPSLLRGL